jgi:hypothetical protein
MAKQKVDFYSLEDSENENDFIELTDDVCDDIVKSISKNRIIAGVWVNIVEPYEGLLNGQAKKTFVKPAEYMKAIEIITKLKGFDKETGEQLPDTINIELP